MLRRNIIPNFPASLFEFCCATTYEHPRKMEALTSREVDSTLREYDLKYIDTHTYLNTYLYANVIFSLFKERSFNYF